MNKPQAPEFDFVLHVPAGLFPGYVFDAKSNEILCARLTWRILFQIAAVQLHDYKAATTDEEREQWMKLLLETLVNMNERAQIFNPQEIPLDITPPTDLCRAQNVMGNWCIELIHELTCLFTNAKSADILKISHSAILTAQLTEEK